MKIGKFESEYWLPALFALGTLAAVMALYNLPEPTRENTVKEFTKNRLKIANKEATLCSNVDGLRIEKAVTVHKGEGFNTIFLLKCEDGQYYIGHGRDFLIVSIIYIGDAEDLKEYRRDFLSPRSKE